jgi:hypothetical protein
MTHKTNISRRDFIKSVATAFIGTSSVLGLVFPPLLSALAVACKTEDDSIIDLGPLENIRLGFQHRFEFTRTRVNGWERTATNYGLLFCVQTEKK